jgi:hypothetical protein
LLKTVVALREKGNKKSKEDMEEGGEAEEEVDLLLRCGAVAALLRCCVAALLRCRGRR